MPIRILHLIGSLNLGGAQVVLQQIVGNSRPEQYEHFVYPLRAGCRDIPITKNLFCHSYPPYDPRKISDILRICREQHIDIIHTHLHKDAIAGIVCTVFEDIPVVVHEHGAIFLPGMQYSLFRLFLKCFHRRAACFIANSAVTAEKITAAAGVKMEKIEIIPNAVDTSRFRPDSRQRLQIRERLGLKSDHQVIGFVGRLHRDKGIDLLVEAMGQLVTKSSMIRLVIVGNGPMESSLRQRAKDINAEDKIMFAGFQPHPEDWINAFDIACLPSRNDSFGLAAAECMASGVPVLCTAIDGLGELARQGRNALIIKDNTPGRIAEAAERLLTDKDLQKSLSQNAAAFAATLAIPVFIDKLESLYGRILGDRTQK